MDWIDEQAYKIVHKLKITTLKNTLNIYIIFGIIAVFAMSVLTIYICDNWIQLIIFKYDVSQIPFGREYIYLDEIYSIMQNSDKILTIVIKGINSFSPIIYSIITIAVISKLYYKNKLEEPLNILKEEASRIANEDYSFECKYETLDEMGEICETFDSMRRQLIINKEKLWKQINAERKLKATFAHDLRTPVTVLKGYTELLLKYYPEGKVSDEKMLETLHMMKNQIMRLEKFGNTMKQIDTLEELKINKVKVEAIELIKTLESAVKAINDTNNKNVDINFLNLEDSLNIDIAVVMQVLDNLLSNSLRFCNHNINITITIEEDYLLTYVKDDGRGFTQEELKNACQTYYSSSKDEHHYGLGLSICKLLCEKHNGYISLSNSIEGGAIVCVTFLIK